MPTFGPPSQDEAGALAATDDTSAKRIHVYPLFGREHVLEGMSCWCEPEVDEEVDEYAVVIHNPDH